MTHEKCAGKRPVGAFETDLAGHRFLLRHQPNLFETQLAANFTVDITVETIICDGHISERLQSDGLPQRSKAMSDDGRHANPIRY